MTFTLAEKKMEYFHFSDSFIQLVKGHPKDIKKASLMIAVKEQGLAGINYLPTLKRLEPKKIVSKYTESLFWKTVALVFNPVVSIKVEWEEEIDYTIEELCEKFCESLDSSDDLHTQFKKRESIKQRIRRSKTFEDLVKVYKWTSHER